MFTDFGGAPMRVFSVLCPSTFRLNFYEHVRCQTTTTSSREHHASGPGGYDALLGAFYRGMRFRRRLTK